MTKYQVITIGSVVEDLLFLVNESRLLPGPSATCEKYLAFEYGAKIPIGKIKTCLGGAAANVAAGLAKLGIRSCPCVAGGGDEVGRKLKRAVAQSGASAQLFQILDAHESDRSIILVEPTDRDRTIFYSNDAGNHLKLKDISQWKTDWVYISSLKGDWEKKLGQILKLRKDRGVKIAWNPGRAQIQRGITFLEPLLKETSLLFMNWDEALELALSDKDFASAHKEKAPSQRAVARRIQVYGPKIVVITSGRKGSLATNGYLLFRAPILSPEKIELTGAGDAFSSGFLASWIHEPDNIKRAQGWGMANSGSVVMYFGAQKGLLNERQMHRKINDVLLEAMIEEERL